MLEQLLVYDKELLIYLNNLGESQFDTFWKYVTKFICWIPLLFFIFYKIYKKLPKRKAIYIIGYGILMMLISLLLVEIIKIGIERVRPCNDPMIAPFLNIVIKPTNYSFFSGHATVSFALTTFLVLMIKKEMKFIYVLYCWPLVFIYSRLYFGVHYPSDIFVGMLVGIFIGFAFHRFCNIRKVKL